MRQIITIGLYVHLMAVPDLARFYKEFGFRERPPECPGMQMRRQAYFKVQ